jgi:hypothetical protein
VSAASRRGAYGEGVVEKAIRGARRVKRRPRFESMPDIQPVPLPDGNRALFEVKTKGRGKFPKWLRHAVAQAGKYGPGVPIAVFVEMGGERLAVLRLDDLVALLGLDVADDRQPSLFGGR